MLRSFMFYRALPQRLTKSYHQMVVDHYENPRNVGTLDSTDRMVGTGLVGAPACGDVMKLQIEVKNGTIIKSRLKLLVVGPLLLPHL